LNLFVDELDHENNSSLNSSWILLLAVQCLGEVRNSKTIADSAERVLKSVCQFIDGSGPNEYGSFGVRPRIVQAAEAIGTNWPNREFLVDWLEQRLVTESGSVDVQLMGTLIGSVGLGLDSVYTTMLKYIDNPNAVQRMVALVAFGRGWCSDSTALSKARHLAKDDENSNVRSIAARWLVENSQITQKNLDLVYDLSVTDADPIVRREILSLIITHLRDSPKTLNLVRERAMNDDNHIARADALVALGKYWPKHPDTLSLLQERAENDPNLWLRSIARGLVKRLSKKKE
jgi:hypothetical protein